MVLTERVEVGSLDFVANQTSPRGLVFLGKIGFPDARSLNGCPYGTD